MKQFNLTFVLTVLMSMVELQVFADWDFQNRIKVNGVYYYLDKDNNQAWVTHGGSQEELYTGHVTIPSSINYEAKKYSVTDIEGAFGGCSGLTSVTLPNSLTSIGYGAFYGCTGLTSVVIPNSVTSIGGKAFYNCSNLIAVIIPNSVTSFGEETFGGCTGLTSITIPNSMTSIGAYVFKDCSNLIAVNIPNSVTYIGSGAFSGCSGLTSISIPNSVTTIGYMAFINCSGLSSITIPNSVTSIEMGAFSGCSALTSITIPNSVTSIKGNAFQHCDNLISVTMLNPTPVAINSYVFTNRTNATLYVPQGSKSAYQAADYWKEFKEIIEIDPSGIDQIMSNGQNNAKIFTLDGKRISEPQKGINIIGGQKVVVK